MRQFEPLPDTAIVYRSMLRKQWIDEDTGRVKADAYFLRGNEPGLSVNLASTCSPQQCAKMFRKCYAAFRHLLGLYFESFCGALSVKRVLNSLQ
jgi:hypothetical protein